MTTDISEAQAANELMRLAKEIAKWRKHHYFKKAH